MSTTTPSPTPTETAVTPVKPPGADIPRTKAVPWYKSTIGFRLTATGRNLFEQYSHIARADIDPHIFHIRDLAWEIFPWPCVGEFWFVSFGLSLHPKYPALLSTLLATPTTPTATPIKLLDLGTCLGQDLRKLHFDGVPLPHLFGTDLFPAYESLGQLLFRDAHTFTGRFIPGDLFALPSSSSSSSSASSSPPPATNPPSPSSSSPPPLAQTLHTWTIIVANMFLHVFDYAGQVRACAHMLDLLVDDAGAMVIGAQTASVRPGEHWLAPPFVKPGERRSVFRQSRETFVEMWEEVGRGKGVAVRVWAEYEEGRAEGEGDGNRQKDKDKDKEERFFTGDEQRRLYFVVERV